MHRQWMHRQWIQRQWMQRQWIQRQWIQQASKTLKSLTVTLDKDVTESCLFAFCIDIAIMLQENMSLESLSIQTEGVVGADSF